ncbi:hypothetical protein [Sorangium sp. So ce394]|uniref:hypothetical protein n=1 Tax=Sorangium sp. So ce394 TaxID=3133310 RepID=UPI003F5BA085
MSTVTEEHAMPDPQNFPCTPDDPAYKAVCAASPAPAGAPAGAAGAPAGPKLSPIGEILKKYPNAGEQTVLTSYANVVSTKVDAADGQKTHASAAGVEMGPWERFAPKRLLDDPGLMAIDETNPHAVDYLKQVAPIAGDPDKLWEVGHAPIGSLPDPLVRMIDDARSMIPQVPLQSVSWRGKPGAGVMFNEPAGSPHDRWQESEAQRIYDQARARLDTLTKEHEEKRKAWDAAVAAATAANPAAPPPGPPPSDAGIAPARLAAFRANAAMMFRTQEGQTSTLNTYDGRVLTWGMGYAAPGGLPQIFNYMFQAVPDEARKVVAAPPGAYPDDAVKRANRLLAQAAAARKFFYVSGFIANGYNMPDGWHGDYLIADTRPDKKRVVRGTDFPDGTYHINAAVNSLQTLVDQREMLFMMVQAARDELTRELVFEAQMKKVHGYTNIAAANAIATQECFNFAVFVAHAIYFGANRDLLPWAIKGLTGGPSPANDVIIVRRIIHYLVRRFELSKIQNALLELRAKKSKGPIKLNAVKTPYENDFGDAWFFQSCARHFDRFLKPIAAVPSWDPSKIMQDDPSADPDAYFVKDTKTKKRHRIGTIAELDLLWPPFDPDVSLEVKDPWYAVTFQRGSDTIVNHIDKSYTLANSTRK